MKFIMVYNWPLLSVSISNDDTYRRSKYVSHNQHVLDSMNSITRTLCLLSTSYYVSCCPLIFFSHSIQINWIRQMNCGLKVNYHFAHCPIQQLIGKFWFQFTQNRIIILINVNVFAPIQFHWYWNWSYKWLLNHTVEIYKDFEWLIKRSDRNYANQIGWFPSECLSKSLVIKVNKVVKTKS